MRYAVSDDGVPVNSAYDAFSVTFDHLCNQVTIEADQLSDMIYDIGTGEHSQSIVAQSVIRGSGPTDDCVDYLYQLVNAPDYLSLTDSTLTVKAGSIGERDVQAQQTVTL